MTVFVTRRVHKLVEIFVSHIVASLLDPLLQLADLLQVLALLTVLGLLLEVFESLVELLVFSALLLLLKRLNLDLLLQKATLNVCHVRVRLKHLRKEVVWARDRHF